MRSLRYNHIFFHWLTCLCELLLCRRRICATMRYIGAKVSEGKKKYFKDFLLWHYLLLFLPLRKAAAEFALCQRAEESDSFIWPTTISRTIWKAQGDFFFFLPGGQRAVCTQPSPDLFIYLFFVESFREQDPLFFSPTFCLHPSKFHLSSACLSQEEQRCYLI